MCVWLIIFFLFEEKYFMLCCAFVIECYCFEEMNENIVKTKNKIDGKSSIRLNFLIMSLVLLEVTCFVFFLFYYYFVFVNF